MLAKKKSTGNNVCGEGMGLLEYLAIDKPKENILDSLTRENLPLFIWGSGNVAELVRKYLKQKGISEAGYFEWPNVYHKTFHGSRVYSLEELEQDYSHYNVIVGHSSYSKSAELLKHASNINRVFYLFSFDYCKENCNTYFERDVIMEHIQQYEQVYENLADQKSRDNLAAFFNTKLTGNVNYIFDVFEKEMDIFNNDVYVVNRNECYWNIGGGKGETVRKFLENVGGKYNQIVVLEPDADSYASLCEDMKEEFLSANLFLYRNAAWKKREKVGFILGEDVAESGCVVGKDIKQSREVEGIPLDELFLDNKDILPPTLMSANYFYGITEMLNGCGRILQNSAPRLAIVVGHNDECGIWRTVQAIWRANPKYKIYLRLCQALATTLVLYATVKLFIYSPKERD